MSTSLANTILSLGLGLGLTFGGITFIAALASGKDNPFSKHGTVTATRKGDMTNITVKGINGWNVNTEYNAKITLGDTVLRKADGLYKDINKKGDKACEAAWYTKSPGKTGTVKLVFCNEVSCTAPIATDFTVR